MTDRLQGGMKHAPGVMCIIRGIPSYFIDSTDNNKIVTIKERTPSEVICPICGEHHRLRYSNGISWQVESEEFLVHCRRSCVGSRRGIQQCYLIPIGDSSLIEGEKWEATNPKEDKIEQAQVLVAKFRKAYPAITHTWREKIK